MLLVLKIVLIKLNLSNIKLQGYGDNVCCFACDASLWCWDPEDDPWIEHCRLSPTCPYLREEKGDEYIALVQASINQEEQVNVW